MKALFQILPAAVNGQIAMIGCLNVIRQGFLLPRARTER